MYTWYKLIRTIGVGKYKFDRKCVNVIHLVHVRVHVLGRLYFWISSIYIIVRARCESCSKYTTGANAIAPMDALGEEMEDFDEDLENSPPTKTDPPKVSTHALICFPDNDVIMTYQCPGIQ